MKSLFEKAWAYDVLVDEHTGRYFIEVFCGGVGSYLVRVQLTDEQVASFLAEPRSLDALAVRVREELQKRRSDDRLR